MSDEQLTTVDDKQPSVTEEIAEEIAEVIAEEVTEEVNVLELIEEEEKPAESAKKTLNYQMLIAVSSLVIAVAALIFSIAKTDLKIGQGELYVESGVVNEKLGNLIRNDLAARIPAQINLREVNIQVVLYGNEDVHNIEGYSGVSDINESDSVSAEIIFFPQTSIEAFAGDCRVVLDAMQEQDVIYERISFVAKDSKTEIHADLSGRFSIDISVEELMAITFYFGEFETSWENEDMGDIEDVAIDN